MSHYTARGATENIAGIRKNVTERRRREKEPGPKTGLGDGDELVADAALADDAPGGLRVVLQLLAEAADVHLQVIDLVSVLAAPHLGQQGMARQHPSRVAG